MSNQLAFEQLSRYNEQKAVALEKAMRTIQKSKAEINRLRKASDDVFANIVFVRSQLGKANNEINRLKGVVKRLQWKLEQRDRNDDPEWKPGDVPFRKYVRYERD
jgi:TolA-binding protein